MDPNATYDLMRNPRNDLTTRRTAAVDLLSWLARGGHAPDHAMRIVAIRDAETILLDAIDDAEPNA